MSAGGRRTYIWPRITIRKENIREAREVEGRAMRTVVLRRGAIIFRLWKLPGNVSSSFW
jgi:hypothetical protein